MKILTVFLLIVFLAFSVQASEVKKADRPLDVGVELSADPNVHEAIYEVLKAKGISCSGLSTKKDGIVTIINSSSDEPKITVAEIQAEINKIKTEQDIEKMIQAEIRVLSIQSLKDKGKLDKDYKDKDK